MFCKYCGKEIADGAEYCPNCGGSTNSSFEKMGQAIDSVSNKVDEEVNRAIDSVGNAFNPNGNQYGNRLLKTDRSLLVYILLNIITCGIYSFFFIHSLAKDVNEACKNDSEKTPGVGMFILMWAIGVVLLNVFGLFNVVQVSAVANNFQNGDYGRIISMYSTSVVPMLIVSVVTGIYPLYWRFKLGNKLQRNGQQYGIMINENGSTVLIWDIVGIVCCCIGSLYALYILIKNTNTICTAYNSKYIFNR